MTKREKRRKLKVVKILLKVIRANRYERKSLSRSRFNFTSWEAIEIYHYQVYVVH